MDTNMTPINDSDHTHQNKQQMNFMNEVEDEDNHDYFNKPPPPPPQHQQMMHQFQNQQQIYPLHDHDKKDVFANIDKNAYVIIFIAFILGFFMGKTMQPVILRHG